MKFLPTIELSPAVYAALRNGQLRLQTGQWIRIPGDPAGVQSKPSRQGESGTLGHRTP